MVGDPGVQRRPGPRSPSAIGDLEAPLLAWYDDHGRDLAIRRLHDPYAIWLAETMSQQTQINRVGDALPAFLEAFPDVGTLASASVGELLRAWGGLGYPRRALALRNAAQDIVERFGGRLPSDVAALESLPGVGPYTARAVAATAFGMPVTALDVNARRVLQRVLTGTSPAASATKAFQEVADALAPTDRAADWNHALMDLGATICRPRPVCGACPLQAACEWYRGGAAEAPSMARRVSEGGPSVPFRDTNRYVRGRALACLRDSGPGEWITVDAAALSIPSERLRRAMTELEHEGLIEIDGRGRARLPLT